MSELTDYEKLREKPSLFVSHILGVECFDYQKELLDGASRHRVMASGRQVGKSRICAWLALHQAITEPYKKVLITAPSLRQSSLLFDTLYSEIEQSGMSDEEWGIDRDTQTIIEFDNGSSIHCLPTGRNGNKIRGFTADMVIVDEAAFINNQIFEEILEPMLFATQGRMVLASTPYGTSGFFYQKFDEAEYDSEWERMQVASMANPLVDDEDIEKFKRGKTQVQIDREVHGKFRDAAGQFFDPDDIKACLANGPVERVDETHASLGVDIAGTGTDRSVFIGIDGSGNVFYHKSYDEMGILEAAGHIKKIDSTYDFNQIYVDRTAIGQGTVEKLANDPQIARKHEAIYFSVQKKQEIYQRLKAALEAQALTIPPDNDIRRELDAIQADELKSGNLSIDVNGDDVTRSDHADAMALAVWGLPEFGDVRTDSGASRAYIGQQNQPKRGHRDRNPRGRLDDFTTANSSSRRGTHSRNRRRR